MMQAARSGRQNIAEGSRAAATSSQTELRMVNVARSSLEELLLDYEDFLRHRRLPQWHPDGADAMAVRQQGKRDRTDPSDPTEITKNEKNNFVDSVTLLAHYLTPDEKGRLTARLKDLYDCSSESRAIVNQALKQNKGKH